MNICFCQPSCFSDLRSLASFLWAQNLGYPRYDEWVDRAVTELDAGYKTAILAIDDGRMVGNVIFQPHKEIAGIREIKNLRVDESVRDRRFGSFLLRQAEWFDSGTYDFLMADFRANKRDIERLMLSEGYQVVETKSIYDEGMDKIVIKPKKKNHV